MAGNAAFVVDPDDESSIAKGLQELLENASTREELRHRGPEQAKNYSWEQTVDIFLEVAKRCV